MLVCICMILEIQPLFGSVSGFVPELVWGIQYKVPVAKTADTPIFLFIDICKRQIAMMGIYKIVKSESVLMIPPAMKTASLLIQWPGTVGFQILFLGRQDQISMGRLAR